MTPAASLLNAPAARPSTGDSRLAEQADRDDSFARMLDDERADHGRAIDAEQTQPAPPPPVDAPERPKPIESGYDVAATETSHEEDASAKTAFRTALNTLNSDDANGPDNATDNADVTEQPVADAADTGNATPASASKAGAVSVSATNAAQTNTGLLILAGASASSAAPRAQAADLEETEGSKADGPATDAAGEGAGIAALVGLAQPVVAPGVTQATQSPDEGKASIQPASINGAGAAPPSIGEAVEQGVDTATTARNSKQADATQSPGATPAAVSQPNAHSAASAATLANAVATAAASTDTAAQASANTGSAPSQPAAPSASTSTPLTDATRAVATPPALQAAPSAAIQVYARFIERADGRAQHFEVRLDPAELGRVDIRIEIGADRKVHAVMAAHDSAALTDLMRGQKALERALSDAGIDLADNGLRFEIAADSGRGGASQHRDGDASSRQGRQDAWRKFDTVSIPVSAEAAAAATPMRRTQRLDLVA